MKYAFNKYYILLSDSYYYYCYALSILSLIAYDLKVQVKDTMKWLLVVCQRILNHLISFFPMIQKNKNKNDKGVKNSLNVE